jgi:hypothetical protein
VLQEVTEKSMGTRKKRGNHHVDSSALVNTERLSDQSKKTNPKKREPEQDLTTDVPAKRVKTNNNGSKKVVGRLDDDRLETVAVTKPSKQSKSSKLSEPSNPQNWKRRKGSSWTSRSWLRVLDLPSAPKGLTHPPRHFHQCQQLLQSKFVQFLSHLVPLILEHHSGPRERGKRI